MAFQDRNYMHLANGLWLGRTSKVAQTTLTNIFAPTCLQKNATPVDAENDRGSRRIAFIRHPLERLVSAFHYFNGRGRQGPWPGYPEPTMSWEEFIDSCALQGQDHHWAPQANLHRGRHGLVPTEWYCFDDLIPVLIGVFGVPESKIDRRNASKPGEPVNTAYRLDEIREFFAEDWDLYRNADIPPLLETTS